ncbi:fumarate reductase subunit C [Psychromonas sp. PT13]|uniref:fumarate reductase subunit C n=1 Tax=Psychromonas sp. PT13 TaxID=3439547 RepID=UPI003EBCCFAB
MSKRKPYVRKPSPDWWLKKTFYTKYMLRESTCIWITIYSLILAWGVFRLTQGEAAFNGWLDALQSPISIILHLVILVFAVYHTTTWFSLVPRAADLWFKGKKVEQKPIVTTLYTVFALVVIFCFAVAIL